MLDAEETSLGILEIKCPYTYRLSTVEDATDDRKFFAIMVNGKVTLNRTDRYYCQVQGQMALAGVLWCDFIIFTFKNHTVERIRFNNEFWDDVQTRLTSIFFKYILPASSHDIVQ